MKPYSEKSDFENMALHCGGNEELEYFFEHAFHDMRFFLETITSQNAVFYTFFGDLEKHLYYISDNMRDDFGFEGRIVHDLQEEWEKRVYSHKWQKLYRKNLQDTYENKRDEQDVRYQVLDKNGNVIWVRWYGRILWNEDRTKPLFMAGRVAKQSDDFICDPLTRLPLTNVLESQLGVMKKMGRPCYLLGLSLNHIASINIHYSHEFSNALIKDVIEKAVDALIDDLNAYRLSSTRYMFTLEHGDESKLIAAAAKLEKIVIDSYHKANIKVDNPCTFAVIEYKPEEDPVAVVRNLELLMTHSTVTSADGRLMEESLKALDNLKNEASLSLALINDVHNNMENFSVVIQPIVKSNDEKILGGEMLLRWKYNGSNVSPMAFIPILEKEFLMPAVGIWILEKAVEYCAEIVKIQPDFLLTVNISKTQLYDDSFVDSISDIFSRHGLDGSHIVFEITESTIDSYPEEMHRLEEICMKMGILLAIDDFGTGYSSLHSLMEYKFNYLKIDRSLLLDIEKSYQNRCFIESLIWACHRNNMKIVMEGVENTNQSALTQAIHCDLIQGYLYHRPAPADEIFTTLQNDRI